VDTFARSCDLSADVQWWSRTAASCGRPLGLSLTAASTPESGGSAGALCLQRGENVLLGQFGNQRVECDAVLGTPSTRLKRLIVSSNASEPCGKAESTSDGRMSCPRESGLAPDSPLEGDGFEPSVLGIVNVAAKPGFSTFEGGCGREMDSPLEGTGFEPSVPTQEKWSMPDQTRGRSNTAFGRRY
jgi:hypothetical protein